MKQKKSGFTLLELLIVVAILAVLVALALPFFQDYLAQSRRTAAQADLTSYQKALASFDQLETTMFGFGTATDFPALIGKYIQDFRAFATQTAPLDPWGSEYVIYIASGTILSFGPNAVKETTGREPLGDDLIASWKPEFFVSDVKKVGDDKVELTFTRKVSTLGAAVVTLTGAGAGASTGLPSQKMSDTVYRFPLDAAITPNATFSASITTNEVVAQDGKILLATDLKPDGVSPANIASYTPLP